MNIKVMSRAEAVRFTHRNVAMNNDNTKNHYFIISISNKFDETPLFAADPDCKGICYLNFDDVEKGEKNCISEYDVENLMYFLVKAFKKNPNVENIIVHCQAGQSRSAGMAAALLKFYNGDDWEIFNNPRYTPNMTVYRMVLERLMGAIIDEEEINIKEQKNIAIWKAYNEIE